VLFEKSWIIVIAHKYIVAFYGAQFHGGGCF
jgi:hypothetical protein